MNILLLLMPKKNITYLTTNLSIKDALVILKDVRFNSVPLLDENGRYVGTITEGDLLWFLEENGYEKKPAMLLNNIARNRDYAPVSINESMEQLMLTSLNQNFIPILDDRGFFIGIVTRKDLLNHFINHLNKNAKIEPTGNPVVRAILNRRSIRRYKDTKIDQEVLKIIINSAVVSPTAGNRKPNHVLLVDDPSLIYKVSTNHQRGGQIEKAPYLILVFNDDEIENREYYANNNTSALTMSLLLTIDSFEQLGACWIGTANKDNQDNVRKALGVPDKFTLYHIIAFGVKDEHKEANEVIDISRIHRNTW